MRTRCIILTSLLLIWLPVAIMAAQYHVKQDGTGDFTTIQAAIDAAVNGDTVVVHPGTYYENIQFKGKNIVLRSVGPEDQQIGASTIIDGGHYGSVVTFAGTEDRTCSISGFTITNGDALYGAGILGADASSDPAVCTLAGISNCAISGNSAQWGGGLYEYDGTMTNCIVWGNDAPGYPELAERGAVITYSCIRDWTDGGEGNISDDPLFVTPLGDYYLSCRAAGQAADSPCIDAGNGTAESLGLDKFTTRTDHVPDSGIVDMGYHFPLTLEHNPWILCSPNRSKFSPGDLFVGDIAAWNQGPDIAVDAYVAFVLPDGALISLTASGLVIGTCPWASNVVLPTGLHFGLSEVFRMTVPDCPGSYLFAAALTAPGQFDFISEPSISAFELVGN